MSISETVDEKYRINVDDLDGRARRLVVSNVSYQGIEEMRPVLHFEGLTKRLALTRDQGFDMIRLTHTAVPSDWIGEIVVLKPTSMGGDTTIAIDGPLTRAHRLSLAAWHPRFRRLKRPAVVAIALAAMIAGAWIVSVQWDALWLLLQEWLPW